MRIATIIGARPQFIKASTISRLINQQKKHEELLIHTGQHYDHNMSQQFFDELEITPPAYNLAIGSTLHGKQTGLMLDKIEQVLIKEKPDIVLVYGDTNSTLAGALAASKLLIPVAHVEAGLRSYNRKMPEEINRIVTDHLSTLLFTPTTQASQCLYQEGIDDNKVFQVGDVMYDAALFFAEKANKKSNILAKLKVKPNNYILSTIHRAENTDNIKRLNTIVELLCQLSATETILLLLHPRTKKCLEENELYKKLQKNIYIVPPQGFLDMIALEKNAKAIMTDSGGVQKEAYFHQVPCITLREETEWVELVDMGCNTLCPPTQPIDEMLTFIPEALKKDYHFTQAPYGKGNSANLILEKLIENNLKHG